MALKADSALVLREEETAPISHLSPEQGADLARLYGRQFELHWASPPQPRQLLIRSRGYVGQVCCPDGLIVRVEPKVPLGNLSYLLEWAYSLTALKLFPATLPGARADGLFDFLARELAQGVLERLRSGLGRTYRPKEGELAYGRGRLLGPGQKPLSLRCRYADYSADSEDNRILAWALFCLRHVPFSPTAKQSIALAARLLIPQVQLQPLAADSCVGRSYNRLNSDYRRLHQLCRFFLDGCGPQLGGGTHAFNGFLVHMPTLFERFVAAWLERHIPPDWRLQQQYRAPLRGGDGLAFRVDMALEAKGSGRALAVLDTKYKRSLDEADIQQVVAYAVRLGAKRAYLVYPAPLDRPIAVEVGAIQVRALALDLGGDIQREGEGVLEDLLAQLASPL